MSRLGKQFQLFDPGPANPKTPEAFDPGPVGRRGSTVPGQQMIDPFISPNVNAKMKTPAPTPEEGGSNFPFVYSDHTRQKWIYGGSRRVAPRKDDSEISYHARLQDTAEGNNRMSGMMGAAARTTLAWENAPVETFSPDTPLFTQQKPNEFRFDPSAEDAGLRQTPINEVTHEGTNVRARPWVARVNGENFVMDGHHRFTSGRNQGTGEVEANVLQAKDWDEFGEQFYDWGPKKTTAPARQLASGAERALGKLMENLG